jgi:hypothetical protein
MKNHSYIVLRKQDDSVVCELFSLESALKINKEKYYYMTAQDHLENLNRQIKNTNKQ